MCCLHDYNTHPKHQKAKMKSTVI